MEKNMSNTSFVQVINGTRYPVSIPMHRVESILNRVDKWNERNKFDRALEIIQPFIVDESELVAKPVEKPLTDVEAVIAKYRSQGRHRVIDMLVQELGMSKSSAYYRARKANVQ